ncbi:MAG TPA: LOG family protein [Chlamydiales bacterium]|nr:LOG family protein [Chlamydiales bacterium]
MSVLLWAATKKEKGRLEPYLYPHLYDLVTPDGFIVDLLTIDEKRKIAIVDIQDIFPGFIGYEIDPTLIFFNIKSTLAQIGIEGICREYHFDQSHKRASVKIELTAYGELATAMLQMLPVGAYIGKLFAADDRRRVRDPDYLLRMISRSDRKGRPLLLLGGLEGSKNLILEKTDGRTVAFLSLQDGTIRYDSSAHGFLPTLAKALCKNMSHTRQLLHLHHIWEPEKARIVRENQILLVRTAPLHIRTVYGRVVSSLLPQGFHHTTASVLQPDTTDSGDIYELYGNSHQIIDDIPLEFYTLEPHREHVFFSDREQLLASLDDPTLLFHAFNTAPKPLHLLASVFVVKGTQMKALKESDWVARETIKHEFPGLVHPSRQALMVEKYIESQPQYPFLKAIENGFITSQGVLLCRHFPTPLLKRLLLNDLVANCLKRIYFQYPSLSYDGFFSHEDRAMLLDLAKFGIPVYWADSSSESLLQFVLRPEKDAGFFVPIPLVEAFRKATVLGVYGSNLQEGSFANELRALLKGLLALREKVNHPLLCANTPLALVTGGGPGAMEVGNRVAKETGILSCANIVDFHSRDTVVNEQRQNPFIDIKMTYRLDRLVERQAEFYLDLPIFLPGGIGMDFEYLLEEVRRKTGSAPANPILLFGSVNYWRRKVSSRFQLNQETGMITGSEWISNCFYCVQTAQQGLWVYENFFNGTLPIGKHGPVFEHGFCEVVC